MPDRLTGRTLVIATGHELSLALVEDGTLLAATDAPMARGHAEALVPAIAALLQPFGGAAAGCTRIVVETGPGSFTGLRVGLAAGRALGLAWGVPVLGVRSTLLAAAAARAAGEGRSLLVCLHAPRGQLWIEGFAEGGLISILPPAAVLPAGLDSVRARFAALAESPPRAAALRTLAPEALGEAELLYVRAPDDAIAEPQGA